MYRRIFEILFILMTVVGYSKAQSLPIQTSTLFSGSGNCAACHQAGSIDSNVLRDTQGNDISPVSLWRSTMMANATQDPFDSTIARTKKFISTE